MSDLHEATREPQPATGWSLAEHVGTLRRALHEFCAGVDSARARRISAAAAGAAVLVTTVLMADSGVGVQAVYAGLCAAALVVAATAPLASFLVLLAVRPLTEPESLNGKISFAGHALQVQQLWGALFFVVVVRLLISWGATRRRDPITLLVLAIAAVGFVGAVAGPTTGSSVKEWLWVVLALLCLPLGIATAARISLRRQTGAMLMAATATLVLVAANPYGTTGHIPVPTAGPSHSAPSHVLIRFMSSNAPEATPASVNASPSVQCPRATSMPPSGTNGSGGSEAGNSGEPSGQTPSIAPTPVRNVTFVSQVSGDYVSIHTLASSAVSLLLWCGIWMFLMPRRRGFVAAILAAGLSIVVVLSTGRTEQIALVAALAGLVLATYTRFWNRVGGRTRLAALLVVALVACAPLASHSVRARWGEIPQQIHSRGIEWAGSGRGYLWSQAFKDWEHAPIANKLIGSGYYSDIALTRKRICTGFAAHSDALELLVSTGVLGSALYAALLMGVGVLLVRGRRILAQRAQTWLWATAVGAAGAFLALSLLNGFVRYTSASVPGLLLLGYVIGTAARADGTGATA